MNRTKLFGKKLYPASYPYLFLDDEGRVTITSTSSQLKTGASFENSKRNCEHAIVRVALISLIYVDLNTSPVLSMLAASSTLALPLDACSWKYG